MFQRRLLGLGLCLVGSCALVAALYGISIWKTLHQNNFLRKLPPHIVIGQRAVKLPYRGWYLAGMDSTSVYLGNLSTRNKLLRVNYHSYDTSTSVISVPDTMRFTSAAFVRAVPPMLFLLDGIKPAILSGDITNGRLAGYTPSIPYSTAIPLSANSFILRVYGKERQNVLVKTVNGKIIARYLLEKQGDGIFSTDGNLAMSADRSRLFYSYYYHNRITCLDTNLNVLYQSRSIDTVRHARLKIGYIKSSRQLTLAVPPQFVNEQCTASDRYLFVHSALQADNENELSLKGSIPIDVYNSKNGKYIHSFYAINLNGEKMKDFIAYGHTLIALYNDYLYLYDLHF